MDPKEFRTLHPFHEHVIQNFERRLRNMPLGDAILKNLIAMVKQELLLLSPRYYHDDQDVLSGTEPVMLRMNADYEMQMSKSSEREHLLDTSYTEPKSPFLGSDRHNFQDSGNERDDSESITQKPDFTLAVPQPNIGPNNPHHGHEGAPRWIAISGPCFFLEDKGAHELSKTLYQTLSQYWKNPARNCDSYLTESQSQHSVPDRGETHSNADDFSTDGEFAELDSNSGEPLEGEVHGEAQALGWNPFSTNPTQPAYDPNSNPLVKSRKTSFVHPFLEHGVYFGTNPMTLSMYYGGKEYPSALCVDMEINAVTIDFSAYFKKEKR